jgi:hypothetical protein
MIKIVLFSLMTALLAAGCAPAGGAASNPAAVSVLTTYLQAFTDKNEARMTSVVCKDWTTDALLEYDAFQGVKTKLEGLSCQVTGSENDAVLVNCQGKILASYQNEVQQFDLGKRIYRLQKAGADYQVCGYTEKP